ncbi:hypothetical protein BDV59DRAFT_181917 [Aspergillus ambiguus]|uniref:uncharacterized protein n=1 Tax=Aspergillus ambiguus TaxID=176160 RepID=UPI003CCCA95F
MRIAVLYLVTVLQLSASAVADSGSQDLAVPPSNRLAPSSSRVGAKWLYKRRRGGGGSDSDSDSDYSDSSDSDSSSDSSSGGSSPGPLCYYDKNTTIEMHNMMSYGHYYQAGIGSLGNNSGGFTPEGSGTYPKWDNSSGKWVALKDYDVSYLGDDKEYVYLGGAYVPYLSGEPSPNGVIPKRLDLDFVTAPYPYFGEDLCSVPNSSYAYEYQAKYNWTELNLDDAASEPYTTHLLPVYCCCTLYTVCGCDDYHRNGSFVPVLLEYLGIYNDPQNTTNACSVTVDGELALIINGTLANGSTRADRDMQPTKETVVVKEPRICDSGEASASGADPMHILGMSGSGWITWTMTAGVVFGLGLVLL